MKKAHLEKAEQRGQLGGAAACATGSVGAAAGSAGASSVKQPDQPTWRRMNQPSVTSKPNQRDQEYEEMLAQLNRLRTQRGARKRSAGLVQPASLDTLVGQQEQVQQEVDHRRTAAGETVEEAQFVSAAAATQGELAAMQRNDAVRSKTLTLQSEIAALHAKRQVGTGVFHATVAPMFCL